ncbi:hypothetical protein MXC99_01565 [Thauera aromatica]|uniref:hypothetical protein n=1 Tax=Thauera aromatica TaxID=59405 RepID=UPI001FFC5538|nr:hypothetical protein [Thauera aromatica]MCK2086880.1 hypothetical protein [Thauera aromatica]
MRQPIYESMAMLLDKAHDNLTPAEWRQLTELSAAASSEALRLSEVTASLASLVLADAKNPERGGHFQNADDVFTLLAALSHSLETVAAMAETGSYAASMPLRQEVAA